MKSPLKRRFSAFDDYPNRDNSVPSNIDIPSINKSITEEVFQPVERIERVKPSQMMPDRYQPRRILPTCLRQDFFSGRLTCYETAQRWLKLAETDESYLLQVNQLLSMGASFQEHGQIKPITGNWGTNPRGGYVFYIETGERRFWAACLQYVKDKLSEEPELRVEVIAAPSRFRQVIENRHSEPPSSVSQACEIASIILAELNIHPAIDEDNEFKYFRQVHNHRMPRGLWDRLVPVMQLSRPRMEQLLGILALPDTLLELADRYRLSERVLREILCLPTKDWETAIQLCIRENLSSEEINARFLRTQLDNQQDSLNNTNQKEAEKINWKGFDRFIRTFETFDASIQQKELELYAQKILHKKNNTQIIQFLEKLLFYLKKG